MKDYITLFKKIGELKRIEREGWKRADIEDVESVADHTCRSALIGLLLGKKLGLDTDRLVNMLLIHDLAEIETGDITPVESVSKEEKRDMEKEAIEKLLDTIKDKEELVELWYEFEIGQDKEAKIARDIDKLEMILQAVEYEEDYPEKDLSEFMCKGVEGFETHEIGRFLDDFIGI